MSEPVVTWPEPEGGYLEAEAIGEPSDRSETIVPLPRRELGSWGRWIPLDPSNVGRTERLKPSLLTRSDGHAAIPLGRVSTLLGPPEAMKTFTALVPAREVLADGGAVVYVDFEDDKDAMEERLVALGAPDDAIRQRFRYQNPEGFPVLEDFIEGVMPVKPELVIVDAVTAALAEANVDDVRAVEVTRWLNAFPKAVARLGPAVLLLDHVGKDASKGARGSSAKLDAVSGVSLLAIRRELLTPNGRGVTSLHVLKDRLGGTRAVSAGGRHFADVTFDATTPGRITVAVEPPVANGYARAVERVANAVTSLDPSPERPVTTRAVQEAVAGEPHLRTRTVQEALAQLHASGQVGRRDEGRTALWWLS